MKHNLFKLWITIILTAVSNIPLHAQGIFQLWSNTFYGGESDRGVLFSTKYDGSSYTLRHEFEVTDPGRARLFHAPVAYDSKLYALLRKSKIHSTDEGYGIITSYDLATGEYGQVADLTEINGKFVVGKLVLHNNKFYGLAREGGVNNQGLLFEFDPLSGTLTKLHDFNTLNGQPIEGLTVYDGSLYGLTNYGGDYAEGVLYQYDLAVDTFLIRKHLPDYFSGFYAGLTAYDDKLWGASDAGVFAFDPATESLASYTSFMTIGLNSPYGQLAVSDGKLYGVANEGGAYDEGGIYEFDPSTFDLQLEFPFSDTTAQRRCELTAYSGKLYSASYFSDDYGRIFSYDPVLNTYENELLFSAENRYGSGSMCLVGDTLYGFTCSGGANGEGALYEYIPATGTLDVKKDLGGGYFHPVGNLISYNNKIYGLAYTGVDSSQGGIFEFDPLSGTCFLKKSFSHLEGRLAQDQGGLIFHNNKLYGITYYGGLYNGGVLFEYNPATNVYTKKHDFDSTSGRHPYAQLLVYSGKLYGTTYYGSTNDKGNIFEYNLLENTYTQKVIFSTAMGYRNFEGLTLVDGKMYGVCAQGGDYDFGVLFRYDPDINGYEVKVHFEGGLSLTGGYPNGKLAAYNGNLYGLTVNGGTNGKGVLYEYNTSIDLFTVKLNLDSISGENARAGLTLLNDKLYGTTPYGGDTGITGEYTEGGGILFEYNPISNTAITRHLFSLQEGYFPASQLLSLWAFIAPGEPGICQPADPMESTASNAYEWIPLTDSLGNAIGEINPNGNILGQIECDFYVHNGPVRTDLSGNMYLDRNITIHTEFDPVSPVSVRLYIKKDEFDTLMAQPGSLIGSILDLKVFKNEDDCQPAISGPALPVTSAITVSNWNNGYVLAFDVDAFSSFYFAGGDVTVLPIELISFKGEVKEDHNLLIWEAAIDEENTLIHLERSEDGKAFETIYTIDAKTGMAHQDYEYRDYEMLLGRYYYRLEIQHEEKTKYSNILLLNRETGYHTGVKVYPNPVKEGFATLEINAKEEGTFRYSITDLTGRTMLGKQIRVQEGVHTVALDLSALQSGIYYLTCSSKTAHYPVIKIVKH